MALTDENLEIYLAHRRELIDYATVIVGDRASGEEVVQEAYLRLKSAAAQQILREPIGYLRRIVRNLALDWRRRLSIERRHFDAEAAVEEVAEERPTLEDGVAGRDDLRIVLQALDELPARTRTALEMHRFEGAKLKDIAARLGISVGLAHSLVFQGLEHCRKRLAEHG